MWLLLIEIVLQMIVALRDAIAEAIGQAMAATVQFAVGFGALLVGTLLQIAGIAAIVLGSGILLALFVWRERRTVG